MKKIFILFLLLISIAGNSQNLGDGDQFVLDSVINLGAPNFDHSYEDPYAGKIHPWGWSAYEKAVFCRGNIIKVEVYDVHYRDGKWIMGVYPFTGDTTKLIRFGWQYEDEIQDCKLIKKRYPAFYYYNCIRELPTIEGFERYKANGRKL